MSSARRVFIGSSSEAESIANRVIGGVIREAGIEPVPWRGLFPPNAYPLEVFERTLPDSVAGAIMLATPDVFGVRRDATFDAPAANVILEYGYLTARLTRSRVAVCRFDGTTLPSDLDGLTTIKSGLFENRPDYALPAESHRQLRAWLDGLPRLAQDIPAVRQLHGYSGQWAVKSSFSRWRGRDVRAGEHVVFNGFTALAIGVDGGAGSGMQRGVLSAALGSYRETRRICNEVISASVDRHGILDLTIRVHHRELAKPIEGTPPVDLGDDWLKDLAEAPAFKLVLQPVPEGPRCLSGEHVFDPSVVPHHLAHEEWRHLEP